MLITYQMRYRPEFIRRHDSWVEFTGRFDSWDSFEHFSRQERDAGKEIKNAREVK